MRAGGAQKRAQLARRRRVLGPKVERRTQYIPSSLAGNVASSDFALTRSLTQKGVRVRLACCHSLSQKSLNRAAKLAGLAPQHKTIRCKIMPQPLRFAA